MSRPGSPRATKSRDPAPDCAALLRALGDASRLSMLQMLLEGPQNVGELVASLELEQSLVSHHLRVLRDAGLVQAERDGKSVRYSLAPGVGASGRSLQLKCCELVLKPATPPRRKAGAR